MNRMIKTLALTCAALAFVGCESRTDKVDGGGVLLSLSDFDGLPVVVSASGDCCSVAVESMTLQSVIKNPGGASSDLMNVEIQSYEVTFTRADTGTRVPPKLVNYVFGIAPANGTFDLLNGPFMRAEQFNTQPILDLKNRGIDSETGSRQVRLNVGLRFFGHTLGGNSVESNTAFFTLEVTP